MAKTESLDMTQGNPLSLLIKFSIPLISGSIFQQLYSLVDTAIVGRCINSQALTAVGVTGALNFLVLGLTMGCAMGFTIPISQSVGANNKNNINRYFWNGLYLSIAIGILISVGSSIFARSMLVLLKTPDELLNMATEYIRFIFAGQITTVLYNYLAGVLRAFGDSKRPFYFLLISSCLNIVLDLFFIFVVPMGVVGVALATVLSQGISAVLCAWWIFKKIKLIHKADENGINLTGLSKEHIKKACATGIPLGLEYSVTSIGNLILQGSINTLGTVVATAQICGERIRSIATLPMESVGMAMATYVGQNYGAKRPDRIKSGVKCGMIIQAVYCVIAWVLLAVLKKPSVYLLLGEATSLEAQSSIQYLTIISTLFIFHGSLMIFRNAVQGMGYSASALASSIMEIVGRGVAGVLAVKFNSFMLICISAPMAWLLALACCLILYAYYMKKSFKF